MPECHSCPYNGKGNPICITCKGPPSSNHKGRTFVSIDAGDDEQTAAEVAASLEIEKPYDPQDDPVAWGLARKLAYEFTEMSPEEFALVKMLMRGLTQAQAGRIEKVTRSAINSRLKTLIARNPVFSFLRDI